MKKFYIKSLTSQVLTGSMIVISGMLVSLSTDAQTVYFNNYGAKMNVATIGTYLNIDGTFKNQTGGAIQNNGTIEVSGNWDNDDANGVFENTPGIVTSGTVKLDGAAQIIDGSFPTRFFNLTISEPPAPAPPSSNNIKTLNQDIIVGGYPAFTGTAGILHLEDNILELDANELEITNSSNLAINSGSGGKIISETTPGSGYGYIKWDIATAGGPATTQTTFSNLSGITINALGTATPYSSDITVAAMPSIITNITVNINGLTHTNPSDIDMILISPTGEIVSLMSDCGSNFSIAGVNLTFENSGSNLPPSSIITTGTYRPTNHAPTVENYPAPGPGNIFNANNLTSFDGLNPNGVWRLYIVDDEAGNSGTITSWSITVTSTATLATTDYVIPFATTTPYTDIPFIYTKVTNGTGANGSLKFATYPTDPENNPLATSVTGLYNDYYQPSYYYAVDRFWMIEHDGYSAGDYPKSKYTFTWDPIDPTNHGINPLTGSNLRPQRFNPYLPGPPGFTGGWGDWLYGPDWNIGNQLGISIANEYVGGDYGGDYLPIWTLVDESNPLPIELIRFAGNCADGQVEVTWTTASETNNDFFTVQRSIDGVTFEDVTIVDGAGNSSSIINYNAVDYNPYGGTSYYRLKQTDFDGTSQYSDVVAVSCGNAATDFNLVNAYDQGNGTMAVVFNAGDNELYTVTLYDIIGKQITETTGKAYSGQNQINIAVGDLARGIYMVNLKNEFKSFGRRVMLH